MSKYRQKRKREVLRKHMKELKMSNYCQKCGLEDPKYPVIFDFDHQKREDKKSDVSSMLAQARSWKMIFEEVCKCQMLCSNCHRKKTWDERNDIGEWNAIFGREYFKGGKQ